MNAFAFESRRGRGAATGSLPRILPMEAETPARRSGRRPSRGAAGSLAADLCYFALRLSGWLAVTLLATGGLYVLFFMALGNMTADGFFAQLANLANRFGAAEPARQSLFVGQLGIVTLVLFAVVAAARFRSLAVIFSLIPFREKVNHVRLSDPRSARCRSARR